MFKGFTTVIRAAPLLFLASPSFSFLLLIHLPRIHPVDLRILATLELKYFSRRIDSPSPPPPPPSSSSSSSSSSRYSRLKAENRQGCGYF